MDPRTAVRPKLGSRRLQGPRLGRGPFQSRPKPKPKAKAKPKPAAKPKAKPAPTPTAMLSVTPETKLDLKLEPKHEILLDLGDFLRGIPDATAPRRPAQHGVQAEI